MSRSVFNHRRVGAATLTSDSMNRANSGSVGTTDGGGTLDPLTWVDAEGTCGITSAQAVGTSRGGTTPQSDGAGSVGDCIDYVDLGTGDVDLSIQISTLSTTGSFVGLLFRFADVNNYWMWGVKRTGTVSQLFKLVAGVWSQVGSDHSGAVVTDLHSIVAHGNTIVAYRNAVPLEITSDSFNATATKHGFYFTDATGAVKLISAMAA